MAAPILLPEQTDYRGTAPIALVDGQSWLLSDFADLRMSTVEMDVTEGSDYADLTPPAAEVSQDDISLVLDCDWQTLQQVGGGTWVTMPEGDVALYDVFTVVVAENSDGLPSSLYGRITVLSPTYGLNLTRTYILNRVE